MNMFAVYYFVIFFSNKKFIDISVGCKINQNNLPHNAVEKFSSENKSILKPDNFENFLIWHQSFIVISFQNILFHRHFTLLWFTSKGSVKTSQSTKFCLRTWNRVPKLDNFRRDFCIRLLFHSAKTFWRNSKCYVYYIILFHAAHSQILSV